MSIALFNELLKEFSAMDEVLKHCDSKIKVANKSNDICTRLNDVLGISDITSSALYTAAGDGK
jgi:transposase